MDRSSDWPLRSVAGRLCGMLGSELISEGQNRREGLLETIIFQALGAVTFLVGSAWLGVWIRRASEKSIAEKASRISHLPYWSCLVLPGLVGFFYPGLTRYDQILGVPSLPLPGLAFVVGLVLLSVGLGFLVSSNQALIKLGRGTAAFLLTRQVVSERVYHWVRNPMSLGYYLACVGIGLIAGSTVLTLGTLLVIVPIHIFNLRYFEERELELRYGQSYLDYKRRVPFLFQGPSGRVEARACHARRFAGCSMNGYGSRMPDTRILEQWGRL